VLHYLFGFRANVVLSFVGAFVILFLIKLTALLPGKYYFSFSKLYAGASEPFIVDPPSVSAAKLCELMAKHNLTNDDLGRSVDCSAKFADATSYPHGAALFEKDEIDKIYSIALAIDQQARNALHSAGQQQFLTPLSETELNEIIASAKSTSDVYRRLMQAYDYQIGNRVESVLSNGLETAFADVRSKQANEAPTEFGNAGPALKALTPIEIAAANKAHAEFIAAASSQNLATLAAPLTKSSVDGIIADAYSASAIPRGVTGFYAGAIKTGAGEILNEKFAQAGIKPIERAEAKQIIFGELVKDGLANYIVSTIIRLLPVLLFGLAVGFVFGRRELFSTSFAGALAAFLLTWPIMLMWDRVVQSSWHDQKEVFLLFYAVYIFSFFLTARVDALIGIRMSEGAPENVKTMIDQAGEAVASKGASWSELAANVGMSVAANGLVAAWNVIIPMHAT